MGWDEPRCVWCHKTGGTIESLRVRVPNVPLFSDAEREIDVLVQTEHRDEARRYYDRVYKNNRVFLLSMVLGVVALIIFAALGWEPGSAAVIVYFGIIFIVFPFTTGTTVELMGIRNSVWLARVTGVVFVVAGFALLSL